MTNLQKTKKALPRGIDALLVTSAVNQRYLTDFDYTDGYVLVTHGKCYVFADSRYIEAAKNEVNDGFETVLLSGGRKKVLDTVFSDENIKTLGYEDREVTCAEYSRLINDFPSVEFSSVGTLLEDIREFKTAYEMNKITASQRIAEIAFEHILEYINPCRTECEVALELEFFMRSHGAKKVSFDIIAVSGRASAMPHGVPRDVKLEKGFLTLDFGAEKDGYMSDMTRTVCIGNPTDEMRKVYETVLAAQKAAIISVAPGKKAVDIDNTARKIITDAGYEKCFGHGLGHGVGMCIHEAPSVSPNAGEKILTSGHIITIEPGIYIEGKFGVRIEDMLYITDDGYTNLTKSPKELIIL